MPVWTSLAFRSAGQVDRLDSRPLDAGDSGPLQTKSFKSFGNNQRVSRSFSSGVNFTATGTEVTLSNSGKAV
jgi:hypothetical protein